MADWHLIHLTFEPELTDKKLEVLTSALKTADYDFPYQAMTTRGLRQKGTTRFSRQVGDEEACLWRGPLIGETEILEYLDVVGAMGHGWIVRDLGDGHPREISADDRFTFGGSFPEIVAAAEQERIRKRLSAAVYQAERAILDASRKRTTPSELWHLALALRKRDEEFKAHQAHQAVDGV